MDHDPRAYLWDAKKSADAIAEFVSGRTFDVYAADPVAHAPRSSGSSKSSARRFGNSKRRRSMWR
jgi:hypothetical protein